MPDFATVQVSLTDLQEMQNHMRETIDQGLQDLQSKQGTGGLPAAPPSAQAKPVAAAYAAVAPPPDPNVSSEIAQVDQQGDQSEKEVATDSGAATWSHSGSCSRRAGSDCHCRTGPDYGPGAGSLGRTRKGRESGPKVIYYYSGMKVTFMNGKVSDVQ